MATIWRYCSAPGCWQRVRAGTGRCAAHQALEYQRRKRKVQVQGSASAEWRALRQRVLARDGQRCRVCGSQDDLTVHLDPRLGGDHRRADADHCLTLCRSCHGRVDQPRSLMPCA